MAGKDPRLKYEIEMIRKSSHSGLVDQFRKSLHRVMYLISEANSIENSENKNVEVQIARFSSPALDHPCQAIMTAKKEKELYHGSGDNAYVSAHQKTNPKQNKNVLDNVSTNKEIYRRG